MIKKIIAALSFLFCANALHAATLQLIHESTGPTQNAQVKLSTGNFNILQGTVATIGALTITSTATLGTTTTQAVGSTMTINGLLTAPAGSTVTVGGTFTATSSTITRVNSSTIGVSGQITFGDGSINSSNTGFIVGASSFNANNVSTATANSTVFVFTNVAITVTLRKSTNKVFLLATGYAGNDTANDGCDFGFYRDSTFISGTNGGQRLRNPAAIVVQTMAFSMTWMDGPGDTSAHTYRVGFRAAVGGTCTLNGVASTDSPIIALEIGQ